MGFLKWLNFIFLYSSALIVIASSRHVQDFESKAQEDLSKSGKPGEYLWYMTSSENGVTKSSIPGKSHDSEPNEASGAIPSLEQEEYLSGSGDEESSTEDMSGSGSYPTSYMVDINENTDVEHNSAVESVHEAARGEEKHEDSINKQAEPTEHETSEQDSSGSGDVEEGSPMRDDNEEGTANDKRKGEVNIVTPAVERQVNPKRRNQIYKKNKVDKSNDDSAYDKLFKDFGTEGDLDPGLEDEDNYLDDSLNEEETKLLMPEGDEDDAGKSKSEISRPRKKKGKQSSTFQEIFDYGSADQSRHNQSHSFIRKEILSKLDIDVFRGNRREEHVNYHRKKQRHQKLHHHHDDKSVNKTMKEADASRALSHHADSGIFNGSISNVTLQAEKVKKHAKHHHKRHHHVHHRHQTQKDIMASDKQMHLQLQPNSEAQYSPQLQSPPIYNPYPSPYPMFPYQANDQRSTSEYEYHSVKDADRQGAVCLDGSTPGYYLKEGSGGGSKKWIIYLQGGAWCDSEEACLNRSQIHLGSSLFFKPILNPGGILSPNKEDNPKFYNWNVAFLPYCDGSSFSGNRSDPVQIGGSLLYFRGFRILDSTISELLSITNLKHSKRIVFSGTSAGGLAVMLHADFVKSKLPKKVHFRALSDSGFFLDTPSRKHKGQRKFRQEMQNVFKLHDCTDGVPQKCVDEMPGKDLWKCIFPQYFLPFVKSKMFIVNPLYDSWQLQHIWEIDCAFNPRSCTKKEVKQIKKFRKTTLKGMAPVFKKSNIGIFADSCVDHGQVVYNNRWNSITVGKTVTISSSFIKWLKHPEERKHFIDEHDYPANPSCVTTGVAKRSDILTEGF